MKRARFAVALVALPLLALGGCAGEDSETSGDANEEVDTRSLAAVLTADDDYDLISDAMTDAGLTQIFDGAAYYTVLAPTDDVLESLETTQEPVAEDIDQRAALVAILRDHILPGYLTTEDIAAAIEDAGGSAEIQTMGEATLTFTSEGDDIRVAAADGASALISGDEQLTGNGVLLPVDGLLKQL